MYMVQKYNLFWFITVKHCSSSFLYYLNSRTRYTFVPLVHNLQNLVTRLLDFTQKTNLLDNRV